MNETNPMIQNAQIYSDVRLLVLFVVFSTVLIIGGADRAIINAAVITTAVQGFSTWAQMVSDRRKTSSPAPAAADE